MAEYTEKQKAEVLARAEEIGIRKAAAEAGVAWQTVTKWKRDAAAGVVKEKAEKAVEDAVEKVEKVAKATEDAATVTEIEVKKTVRKAGRKAAEKAAEAAEAAVTAEKAVKKAGRKAKEVRMNIVVQSPLGGSITADEIAAKVPKGTDSVYVRVDENKLYWVKGKKNGAVDIW